MSGGDRDAQGRSSEDGHCTGCLGGKAAHRFQLGDLAAHGVDDAPAAGERSQGNGGMRHQHNPERDGQVPGCIHHQVAVSRDGEEYAGDDAHGFLGIVGAMSQAVKSGRDELPAPEKMVHAARGLFSKDPEDEDHED